MKELRENNVRVSGGSSLKQDLNVLALREAHMTEQDGKTISGFVRAPFHAQNNYGGFYFYAPHLVEVVSEIFGRYPVSVKANAQGDVTNVDFNYDNYTVHGMFVEHNYVYYACRYSEKTVKGMNLESTPEHNWFESEFKEFYSLLGGADSPVSYEDLFSSVYVMNAVEKSIKTGNEECVNYFTKE